MKSYCTVIDLESLYQLADITPRILSNQLQKALFHHSTLRARSCQLVFLLDTIKCDEELLREPRVVIAATIPS
ncbi:hypothetical protein Y032_0277g1112 [Ancylostoma ceylanicum]|uniref:Uncharacterized protein n=1 Tax=Ancylostoma ceylanicum TaxID=53326 RepID=A0A016S8E3_9BILA|nr:hypothetical protein Y032_0277g1112 [Ancylostoma ceylanicum]